MKQNKELAIVYAMVTAVFFMALIFFILVKEKDLIVILLSVLMGGCFIGYALKTIILAMPDSPKEGSFFLFEKSGDVLSQLFCYLINLLILFINHL